MWVPGEHVQLTLPSNDLVAAAREPNEWNAPIEQPLLFRLAGAEPFPSLDDPCVNEDDDLPELLERQSVQDSFVSAYQKLPATFVPDPTTTLANLGLPATTHTATAHVLCYLLSLQSMLRDPRVLRDWLAGLATAPRAMEERIARTQHFRWDVCGDQK